jgi:subtilisin family serine protease
MAHHLRRVLFTLVLVALTIHVARPVRSQQPGTGTFGIHPDEQVLATRDRPGGTPLLEQATQFINVKQAQEAFGVTGAGFTAAVLDTGINADHVDFHGRIAVRRNFTGGGALETADRVGHGSNVAGIIAARKTPKSVRTDPRGEHDGVAPDAQLAVLKVLGNNGRGDFAWVEEALEWVLRHHTTSAYRVTVVNISIGDQQNYQDDAAFASNGITEKIARLKDLRIPVVVAAGNDFFPHQSVPGMSFPAILRDAISVGAFYDADVGSRTYTSRARASRTAAGRLTPFSQRLHPDQPDLVSKDLRTDIFAPGAVISSTGFTGERSQTDQQGTSQAAPIVTGTILLMQEYFNQKNEKTRGLMPTVEQLVTWLRAGAVAERDNYGEDDNVRNTLRSYPRLDVMAALTAERNALAGK